ncbi:MAG TPA: sterol-binding protein [Burkholderiales bacterium]|nr:sterol-binding protein [Burkholderiales bacterium]
MVLPAVNHVLQTHSWALQRLRAYAGKIARIECGALRVSLSVLPDGELAEAPSQAPPDAVVRLTPGHVLRVLARDETVWSEVDVQGDTGFATTLSQISREVRWDVEEDLSSVLGDIAGHRIAEFGRRTVAWGRYAARNATQSLAEYWTEERPLVTRGRDIAFFNSEVDRLRDDVARLEKRLQGLLSRLGKNAGTVDR